MITDPRFAPRRNDLGYLRRRHRPKARSAAPGAPINTAREPALPPVAASRPATPNAQPDSAVAEFFSGHRPGRESSRPAAPAPSRPAASPPAPPDRRPAAAASSSLDLDAPAAPAPSAAPPASSSLDLDSPAPARAAPKAAPAAPRLRSFPVVRVTPGGRTILGRKSPTVTLTRTQSGVGTLTFEAACSAEVGDLRLGAAYQLRSGESSTLQMIGGNRLAPPRSRRPVLVGAHDRYERISVDLRQSPGIERLAVYAFSESRAQLRWGGTLIVTTFAGAKIEIPLEELPPGEVAVLMSLYNVGGEFVLRAELETIAGSIREAARAYGYDQISWLDDRTPVE